MNWIISLVIGGIVGWLASILMKNQFPDGFGRQRAGGRGGLDAGLLDRRRFGSVAHRRYPALRSRNRRCRPADLHPAQARCFPQGIALVPSDMASVQTNLDSLIRAMESAIAQADAFVASLQEE